MAKSLNEDVADNMKLVRDSFANGLDSFNSAGMSLLQAVQAPLTNNSPMPLLAPIDAFVVEVKKIEEGLRRNGR